MQEARGEYRRYSNLLCPWHLKSANQYKRYEKYPEIRDNVDNSSADDDGTTVEAFSVEGRVPNFLPRQAGPDLDRQVCNIKEKVEPDQEMDGVVSRSFSRDKNPEI